MSDFILVADFDEVRAKRLVERCEARGLVCAIAPDGSTALERALADLPAVLVGHLDLPVIDGMKLAEILEANPRAQGIRVLLIGDVTRLPAAGGGGERILVSDEDADAAVRHVAALLAEERRRAEQDTESDAGVEGELSQLPLIDLLQLFHVSRKTGAIEVAPHQGNSQPLSRIFLRDGDVIQAVAGIVEGEKALFRLLSWDRGSFHFRPNPVSIEARIETPTRTLLREGERQRLEWQRVATHLPPMEAQVTLKANNARLPNVMHPLTQEVLVVLELFSRVRDVVDHCSYPDFQVLRTLQTLIGRELVEIDLKPRVAEAVPDGRLFSASRANRLREWLSQAQPGGGTPRDGKLLLIAPEPESTERFLRVIERLPGLERMVGKSPAQDDLVTLCRLAVDGEVGVEFVHLPVAERFAPLWPVAGHGSLGALVPISAPLGPSLESVRRVARELRRLPGTRLFYLLLLGPGDRVAPEALRENVTLLDDGPLFLIPHDNGEKTVSILREMFGRILP